MTDPLVVYPGDFAHEPARCVPAGSLSPDMRQIGGKAANLMVLRSLAKAVPPFYVVTAGAQRRAMAAD